MPDKPTWYAELPRILAQLRSLPQPWVDRSLVEQLLEVGRRRAQQILAPCATRRVGASVVADRDGFIEYLERLAAGEAAYYEGRRRLRLAKALAEMDSAWREQPRLLVEAPARAAGQALASLPEGITLAPGEISLRFRNTGEALEKLLALAMAIGRDPERFRQAVDLPTPADHGRAGQAGVS